MNVDYKDRERRYSQSAIERLWNGIKPPPSVRLYFDAKRIKRLKLICGIAVVVLAGGMVYSYIAGIPQRARNELQAGMKYMAAGNYRAAAGRFDRARAIQPGLAEASLQRGIAYQYLGESNQALASFDEAIRLNPKLGRAYLERGLIYQQGTNYPRAIAEFTKAISLAPTVDAYVERGQIYEMLGEHQKAIDDYTQAIAQVGNDAPHLYRARSLARRNLGDKAGYEADRDKAAQSEFAWPGDKFGGN